MKDITQFQKRVLQCIASGMNNDHAVAVSIWPDFYSNKKNAKRGARMAAVSNALSVLCSKRMILQGQFDSSGRWARYYLP